MSWTVHPHGPLEAIGPNLWRVVGSLPPSVLPRVMALWILPSGGVCVHSAVNVDAATLGQIEAIGTPAVLIVPNGLHRADAAAWKARYPSITTVAPAAARRAVESVTPVDALAEDSLPGHGVECLAPAGLKPGELIYRVPQGDGTHALVVNDALFNVPEHFSGFFGFMFRYITRSTGLFGITGLGRLVMLRQREAFAGFLRELADAPGLTAIVVSHGDPITVDPAARLREAADRV